jgi:hypothetical protein
MKVLKSLEDVESAGLSPPVYTAAHTVLKNLIDAYADYGETYNPDDDGYLIVIEGGETDAEVEAEVGYNLREALYEGGTYEDGCFVTATLHNNQFGISWVIIDSPALDAELRAKLVEECGEGAAP